MKIILELKDNYLRKKKSLLIKSKTQIFLIHIFLFFYWINR